MHQFAYFLQQSLFFYPLIGGLIDFPSRTFPYRRTSDLNIEEFDAKDTLMVDQVLEPIIMGKEGLVKTGTVTLRKVEL